MAHHKSANKRIRRAFKRTQINHGRLSRVRTFIKRVEAAIAAGDKQKALDEFRLAQPEIMRGVNKGVVPRNTASRRLSRLSARIKALESTAEPA
jgi:small subunit ribosomal protein S20